MWNFETKAAVHPFYYYFVKCVVIGYVLFTLICEFDHNYNPDSVEHSELESHPLYLIWPGGWNWQQESSSVEEGDIDTYKYQETDS